MITNLLSFLRAYICLAFILCNLSLFGQSTTLNLTMQDAQFPTQFNSGGDFYNSGSTELGMWANNNAKQTVAWRNFNSAGDNTGLARALQLAMSFQLLFVARALLVRLDFLSMLAELREVVMQTM